MAGIADLDLPESDEDLLALVFKDDLTGLLNRRFFARYMKQIADWSAGAPPVALAMMDMDNLKRINDRLGHMSGDATLKRLGELFKTEIKDGQFAVRYAGDEFALILPGCARSEAIDLANRLRQAVVKDSFKDAKLPEGLRPSLSIGVACFPEDAPAGGDELTEAADRALYYSKRTGKNRVTSAADIVDAEEVSDLEALAGFPSRTLVGRKAAFEVADEAISLVLDDHFACVLIEGEAGTGKTRLLGEYARYAQERDLAVLIERCTPVSRDDPYRVLANLLDRYLKANPAIRDRALSELSPAQRSALREVLPGLPPDRRRPAGATAPSASRRPTSRRPRRGVRRPTGPMRRGPVRRGRPRRQAESGRHTGRRPSAESDRVKRPEAESARMRRPESESARIQRPEAESARIQRPESESARVQRPESESARIQRPESESGRMARVDSGRTQRPQRDPAELTVSLFMGMLELLKALGRAQPLVILLDNLEHADEPTLEVMRRCLEHEGKVLFVGGARPPLNDDDGSFAGFREDLGEHVAGSFCLTLGPLSPDECRELTTNLLEGHPPPHELSDRLQELTKGNPLFVEGVLRHLIETKILQRTSNGWNFQGVIPTTVPVTLQEVLRQQLQVLDEGTATFLRDAAVVGPNFEIDVLRQVGSEERSEGETLDLVGQAVRTKILVETGEPEGPDLEFASEAIQLETYDSLDEAQRQDAHRRVAEAVSNTPKSPAIKAYHFGRAGDSQKRDRFLSLVRARQDQIFDREAIESLPSGKPPLIPEVTDPAPEDLLEHLPKFAKALATSAKVVRLYPDRSKVVDENMGNLCSALAAAWELTPAFTISHRGNAWTLNGLKLARDVGEGQHHESVVAKLFRGNSIKSLTFVRPNDAETDLAAELKDFLEEVGRHSVQTPVGRHHWDGFARTRKLRSLGVVQKTFVLKNRGRKTKGGDSTKIDAKRLAEANLPLIKDLVRHLMAAIDAIRKYPPGSKVTSDNLANLDRSLRRLFDLVPALAIHEGEDGAIVVNGTQLIANALPAGGAELYTLLHDGKLKGIVLLSAVTPRELARFVARIAKLNPADFANGADPLAQITSDGSLPNVVVGDALYQLAQAAIGTPKKPAAKPQPEPKPETPAPGDAPIGDEGPGGFRWPSDQTALVARELCELEPTELLRSPAAENFVETLDRLLLDERLTLATRLVERLALCFATEDSDDRLRAGEQFLMLAKRGSQELRGRYFQVASRRLADAIELEANPEAFEVLCECTRIGLVDRMAAGDWDVSARLVWAIKRRRQRRSESNTEIKRAATKVLVQTLGDPRIDRVLETIENGSQQERRKAARVMEGMGTLAVDAIVQALKTTGRSRVEAFLIDMLAALAPDSESALRKAVTPFAPAASTRRLLRAAAVVCQNPAAVLITGLQNPDHSVQVEAVNVARSVGGPVASRVLRWALGDGSVPAQITAVKQLGELARGEAFAELLDLLGRADTVELQRECCLALGKLRLDGTQTARVVTSLTNFVRPASFLRSEYHEDVRAAAAWSLGQMQSHEGARRALERVLDDKDKRVRLTAKLSLRGKQS